MKLCFCRLILAIGILVITLVWWPENWAKIVVIIASAILAIGALFINKCCCHKKVCQKESNP